MLLLHRIGILAVALLAAGTSGATAQFFGGQPARPAVCESFTPLQQEAQQGMAALNSANERKAPREEFCEIFKKLSGTMGKVSKFLEQNRSACNIPAESVQRAKTDHAKVLNYRKSACAVATGPSGPSLSDVLGAPVLTESATDKKSSNIFDTLTGNPLTR